MYMQAGAPSYPVLLGRRDGVDSNAAWVDYPSPSSISFESGVAYFNSKGLDQQDYVTLMGKNNFVSLQDRNSDRSFISTTCGYRSFISLGHQ